MALGTALIVSAANASQGAYFSESWGWVALAFLIPTTLVLILDRATVPDRFRTAFALLMLAFAAWSGLSAAWSISAPGSSRELERTLMYASVALAIAVVLRAGDGGPVLAGVLIGTSLVSAYSLATRLIPDHFVTHDDPSLENRLGQPLGYPNGLAALAAVGILVAFAFVSHGRLPAAVPAAVTLPILAATLYFTFSRAAWGCAGIVIRHSTDTRSTLATEPVPSSVAGLPAIACVLVASQQDALTSSNRKVQIAATEGHRTAVAVGLLVALSAIFA